MTHEQMYNLADFRKLEEELKIEHYGRIANNKYITELEARVAELEAELTERDGLNHNYTT